MRKKLIIGLAALNALLAAAVFTSEAQANILPFAIFDCCKNAGTPQGYCCENCCWFVDNCSSDAECRDEGPGLIDP